MNPMNGNPVDWADRRKALDPNVFKFRQYVMNITLNTNLQNGYGSNSVTLDKAPFILDKITHAIYSLPDDQQDGNYTLLFREDQVVYNSKPAMSHALYGSVFRGNTPVEPTLRQFFRSSSTFYVETKNYTNWDGTLTDVIIQMVFHGFEWRSASLGRRIEESMT